MKNMIIGFYYNLNYEMMKPFVLSARRYVDADVILITPHLEEVTAASLRDQGVTAIEYRWLNWIQMRPNMARFVAYDEFVRTKLPSISRIFFSDVTDVVFQDDIFVRDDHPGIMFYLEPRLIGECSVNRSWIQFAYGERLAAELSDKHIACAGTTLVDKATALTYLDAMLGHARRIGIAKNSQYSLDQAIHNVLLHKGVLREASIRQNGDIIISMSHMRENEITLDHRGFITDCDGRLYAVVHQYDRHPRLKEAIALQYGTSELHQ